MDEVMDTTVTNSRGSINQIDLSSAADSTCSDSQKPVDKGQLVPTVWDTQQNLGPQTLTDGIIIGNPST